MSDETFTCTLCGGTMRAGHKQNLVAGDLVHCDRGHVMPVDMGFDEDTGETWTTTPYPSQSISELIRRTLVHGCPADIGKWDLWTIAAAVQALETLAKGESDGLRDES